MNGQGPMMEAMHYILMSMLTPGHRCGMMQVVQRTSHYGAGDAVRRPEPDEPGEPHRLRR